MPRSGRLYLLTLFVLAFLVRFLYARWGFWWTDDSTEYLELARNLAFHHSFGEVTGVPSALRSPLYPFLIAALWWADHPPITAIILLQIIFGAASAVLVYLIARDYFDHRVAFMAALGLSLAPMTCHYTAAILSETLFTFLILLAIFFWRRNWTVAAGVVFGLAAVTRTTVIPFLACLPLLTLLPPWRSNRKVYLLIFLTALIFPVMWTIRNAVVLRKFIFVQSYGYGVNLFGGTIETKLYGDEGWSKVKQEFISNSGASQDHADQDRELLRRGIDRIVSDPARYVRVRLKQYPRLFLDSGDYLLGSQNVVFSEALHQRRFLVVIVKLSFILGNIIVLALAIYGMFIERKRFVSLTPLILFPIFLMLVHLPLWVESRYGLPMIPLLLIFSARALDAAVGWRSTNPSSIDAV